MSSRCSVYDLAYAGDEMAVIKRLARGDDPNMVAMGSSTRQDELRAQCGEAKLQDEHAGDPKAFKLALRAELQRDPEMFVLYKRLQRIVDCSLNAGASFLWTIQQSQVSRDSHEKPDSFFTRVSMRKGPGDVKKGSFTGLH